MKVLTLGPMLLSARTGVLAIGAQTGVQDVAQLQNPSRTPFLLDEIRFRVLQISGGFPSLPLGVNSQWAALPFLLNVRIDMGAMPITSSRYVPLPLLCRTLDGSVEMYQPSLARYFDPFDGAAGGYVWRLPKPLYVPQGMTVAPRFMFSGEFPFYDPTTSLQVFVTQVGRVLPSDTPYPKTVDVPVIGAWVDQVRLGGSDYVAIRSIRSDLKNPYGEPLFVQKMLGTYLYQSNTPALNPSFWIPGGQQQVNDVDRVGNDLIVTRMFKSDGSHVARSATPWNHLFDWSTREMHGNCGVLNRNEFYQLQTDIRLSSLPVTDRVKLMCSMIGYRRVAYTPSGFKEAA